MKYHEYVLLSAMESCPRGRRSMIGNHVYGEHRIRGSNPLLSATNAELYFRFSVIFLTCFS